MFGMISIPSFFNPKAALKWYSDFADESGLEYADNFAFGFRDNPGSMASYEKLIKRGCCGLDEMEITVAGRAAIVGCRYGH